MVASSQTGSLHNIPASLTPLVGRGSLLAALETLLTQRTRLVTLTGPGGAGKTRLATELARRLAPDLPDGAWFVSLAPVSDPTLVPATIAAALGLRETGSIGPEDLVIDWARGRDTLLVLDNFEQVLPAAHQVSTLLAAAPDLRVLVTSRAALRIGGEQEFPVPPLEPPPPDAPHDPALLAANPAVALFVQRARAVRPDFTLDATNANAVADICARVDGLPLALELAAARLRAVSPQTLAARLDRRLTALSSGPRDAPARQRTLRDTIAWSYALLAPEDQALFRRLSVFVGSCSLPAAASVAGLSEDQTLDGLERLIHQSLLQHIDRPSSASRYAMLETVREYAGEQLVFLGEQEAAQEAHADWYLVQAELLGAAVATPAEVELIRRLDGEHDNLRAVLSRCIERGELALAQIERGLRIAIGLWAYWDVQTHVSEVRLWLDRLMERSVSVEPVLRARALARAGFFATNQQDLDASDAVLNESIAVASEHGDRAAVAFALVMRARNFRLRGQFTELATDAEEALAIARDVDDTFVASVSLAHLGAYWIGMNDDVRAATFLDESIAMLRANGDLISLATVLTYRAMVALVQGDLQVATHLADEAVLSAREMGVSQIIDGRWMQALIALEQNDLRLARESIVAAIVESDHHGLSVTPHYFEALALVIARYPAPELAARVLGYSDALRARSDIVRMGVEGRNRARGDADLLAALGKVSHDTALAAGRGMNAGALLAEEAAAYTEHTNRLPAAPSRSGLPSDLLTPRETEVLRLVVAGRTNREIAESLFITQRTAATHVTHILTKLNLESRTAAAAWAVREGIA